MPSVFKRVSGLGETDANERPSGELLECNRGIGPNPSAVVTDEVQ